MAQYSFLDCNYFKESEKDKDIYNKVTECNLDNVSKNTKKNILNPDIFIVKIKDIEKGS
jgi:hypothetical protein